MHRRFSTCACRRCCVRADRDRAVDERQRLLPDTYAPFTIDEYRGMPLDYSFIDQCVEWPVSPSTHPASHVVPAGANYPDIPAIIISGSSTASPPWLTARQWRVPLSVDIQIRVANSFHVNALPHGRSPCAAELVRRFFVTLAARR